MKMKLKSVSSLILLMGTLGYAAMQIGVSGQALDAAGRPTAEELHRRNGSCAKTLRARRKDRRAIRKSISLRHNNARRLRLIFRRSRKLRAKKIEKRPRARTPVCLVFRHAQKKNHQPENFGVFNAAKRRLLLLGLPQFRNKLRQVRINSPCRGPVRRPLIVKTSAECAISFSESSERLNGPGIIHGRNFPRRFQHGVTKP